MIINNKKDNRGVTLIEVVVTIVVSGILFALIGAIVVSFTKTYRRSKEIRNTSQEVEQIENYVSLSIEYINKNGYTLRIIENDDGFKMVNASEEDKNILIYNENTYELTISISNKTLKLNNINYINVEYLNNKGITLTIITKSDNEFVSFYNVFNLYGSV